MSERSIIQKLVSSLTGFNSFVQAIQEKYPDLSQDEIEKVSDTYLREIGIQLRKGAEIAFIHRKQDGSAELHILELEKRR